MKIYKYKFVGTHLKRCGTKELNNICSNYCGNYYMFSKGLDLIKNIKYLNCVYLADRFYSLYELGVDALSTMLHGEYGLEDVCLSLPTLIGEGVVQGRITPELNEKEIEQLYTSANALKSVISQLKI